MSVVTPHGPGTTEVETRHDPLREQAILNLKHKRRFAQNAVAFAGVNSVLWVIWALTDRTADGSMPWPAWVTVTWAFFLVLDAWKAYGVWPRSLQRPITEAEIELEKDRLRRS